MNNENMVGIHIQSQTFLPHLDKKRQRGWRDDSAVKNNRCSSENQSLIHYTTWWFITVCTSISKVYDSIFLPLDTQYIDKTTNLHKINYDFSFFFETEFPV